MSNIAFIDLAKQQQHLDGKIQQRIADVLAHGRYIMGPEVAELEQGLAAFAGTKHCVSCSSGTDALIMPLMAKGFGAGDAVFLPSFTFAATAEVVALLGATPVFIDVRRDTFNIDLDSLKAAIAHAKSLDLKPRAIIPVGMFGQPADLDGVLEIAKTEGLYVIDDAAQSFGASYKGKQVGSLADVTGTSFFPAKPLGCYGDGGAIFTDDDEMAEVLRSIRVHGKGGHKYDNARIGLNARLDTIQAAILLEKLAVFPEELVKRQAVADRYSNALHNYCKVPGLPDGVTSAWAQYTLVLDDRDAMQAKLKEAGVPTAIYYPRPLNQQTAYKDCPTAPDGVPNSDYLSAHVLSLPMHPYLGEDEQQQILDAIIE